MLTEKIDFTFIITTYGIVDYIPIDILINDTVVHSEKLTNNGRRLITVSTTLTQGPAHISLAVTENKKGALRIENVKVAWIADNSGMNSAWIVRADNEVWNYNDPGAEAAFDRILNGPHTKVITLDYATDETVPSYLRNYAYIVDNDGSQIQLRTLKGPYVFTESGKFVIPMTSPVSYWLMERLFVAL